MMRGMFPSFLYSSMTSFYNTLTKKKEVFKPLTTGEVKMYTCGPTVYDYVHIGNLRSYVMADTVRRVLEAEGLKVNHVKNITDVGHLTADDIAQGDSGEDKIERKAKSEGKTIEEIVRFYTDYYHEAEAALNILPANEEPRATEYVPHMIKFIDGLIEKDYAYEKNGNVFFDVTKFEKYGALSGNTLDKLKVGARLEEHPDKKNSWDFALWLKAPQGHLMHWTSPWGEGYPGWHIECSAMNLATLGTTIDIHTGGEDNIFPHHEAEIAQSECGNGEPFVRYWIHARHLLVNSEKMSKSKGNFYKLEDVLERGFSPMDLRMLYLSAHYRSQMNFTWEALEQAKANRKTFKNTLSRLEWYVEKNEKTTWGNNPIDLDKIRSEFFEALHDDLNTQKALASLYWLSTTINSLIDKEGLPNPQVFIDFLRNSLENIFGFKFENTNEIPEEIMRLVEERKEARTNKDFARSDALRDEISAQGYLIEDGPNGQTVRKK